jgi:hypothetical protein
LGNLLSNHHQARLLKVNLEAKALQIGKNSYLMEEQVVIIQ